MNPHLTHEHVAHLAADLCKTNGLTWNALSLGGQQSYLSGATELIKLGWHNTYPGVTPPQSTPDLSTLPQRVRFMASVASEIVTRERAANAEFRTVGADAAEMLTALADKWEAEDAAVTHRSVLVDDLARELFASVYPYFPRTGTGVEATHCRELARRLIESGWTKGDPA